VALIALVAVSAVTNSGKAVNSIFLGRDAVADRGEYGFVAGYT
jgi:hypothetical protein